jgi:hypothetical protein
MLSNEQVLIKTIFQQEKQDRAPEMKDDDYFGRFTTQLVMRKYDLNDSEIEEGITDGGLDGGFDGIYLFVNDDLIHLDSIDYEKSKKSAEVALHLVQSKNTTGFSEDAIMKWKTISNNLLSLEADYSVYGKRYNSLVLDKMDKFREVYMKLIRKAPKLSIHFHYATLATEIHPNLKAQAEELKEIVKQHFPSANIDIVFVTAGRLLELYNSHEETERLMICKDIMNASAEQEYIALVALQDYYRFMTDEQGILIRSIFESNVRDYQGNVSVNRQIQDTLKNNDGQKDFWWLNNGVTILAKSIQQQSGKHLLIKEPEIVNGLQSSSEIFTFFSEDSRRLDSETRSVLVRVIVPKTEESRDQIILATNSQTSIPKSSLRATDLIHRNIEQYYKSRGLFYDRRKNYYKNLEKPIEKIVSIPFLGQCLMATLLAQPDYARARPSTLLEKDATYRKIFNPKTNLQCYYNIVVIGKFVFNVLKKETKYTGSDKTNIQFGTLFYFVARLAKSSKITTTIIESIDIDQIKADEVVSCADKVFAIYSKLGGTDKVAKNSDFTNALITSLNEELNSN